MVIGIGVIKFRIHDCRSLKVKRSVVRAIIGRIRNRFNASVAEVGANDIYDRAEVGFALVGTDRRHINAKADKLLNMIDDLGLAEFVDSELEIITL
ncbi:MAG: DUF503 domain-containing protein [Deltaproteobacteria bacterium]|nr:DUF503 domain-containing protein [Deltaproteobacteria bacterium]